MEIINKYLVLRDTREQTGWFFPENNTCRGTEITTLETGDYTLQGFETKFIIERKGSTSEFSQNVFQDRFERELDRLDKFDYPFVVCEFTMDDMYTFPLNSGIPQYKWKYLKVGPDLLIKRFLELQLNHKVKFELVGKPYCMRFVNSLFKRILCQPN